MAPRRHGFFKRTLHTLALAGLTAVLAVPSAAQQARSPDGPPLWLLADDDSQVYLFGSIHMMKPDVAWFEDKIETAFKAAHTVTFEVDFDDIDPAQVQRFMMDNSRLPEGQRLSDLLPDTVMDELMSVFAKVPTPTGETGIPRSVVEQWRPWFASLQYAQTVAAMAGFMPQYGIDVVLTQRATQAGKPIEGLETITEQFEVLMTIDDLAGSGAFQAQMERYDDPVQLFDDMKIDWLAGDTAGLDALLLDPSEEMAPAFHKTLFDDRNADWVPQIEAMLDEPGTQFVVMGVGHLIGDNSVVDLLEDRGHTVTRQ
ncbi:TraB/GumN family protein [Rhodothalassium salexigens]|uniref:TraB/GumN family protein n=1 Tax=Rhodothalassium salexigens TaxID=1086 RepID=UPI0019135F97|nr:TraB/GumN family protein [Rhodothalassium salexigens]